jgi:hypothetical protein
MKVPKINQFYLYIGNSSHFGQNKNVTIYLVVSCIYAHFNKGLDNFCSHVGSKDPTILAIKVAEKGFSGKGKDFKSGCYEHLNVLSRNDLKLLSEKDMKFIPKSWLKAQKQLK